MINWIKSLFNKRELVYSENVYWNIVYTASWGSKYEITKNCYYEIYHYKSTNKWKLKCYGYERIRKSKRIV